MKQIRAVVRRTSRPFYLVALWLVATATIGRADDRVCRHSITPTILEINKHRKDLLRQLPKEVVGLQVLNGPCAARMRKLVGGEATTHANWAQISEQIACLDLKKFYLEKSCECEKSNSTFTSDEAVQDRTLEVYSTAKKLRDKAAKKGIKNPIIQAYVKSLNRAIDCINGESISFIKKAMGELEKEISAD